MNDNPRLSLIWMLVGSTLLGVIAWQAELSAAHHGVFAETLKPTVPPPRTRSPSRAARAIEVPVAVDPVKTYLTRAKRGLSAKEIHWIAEDFLSAGLTRPPGQASEYDYRVFRAKQQSWYLDALTDGLCLDADQHAAARKKLFELLDRDCDAFRKMIDDAPGGPDGSGSKIVAQEDVARFTDAARWLCDDSFAPWNLCALTKAQRSVTMFAWVIDTTEETEAAFVKSRDGWLHPDEPAVQDPVSGNRMELENAGPPGGSGRLVMGDLFPLTPLQASRVPFDDLPGQARNCHPAQWKAALLMHPDLAGKILDQPDAAHE